MQGGVQAARLSARDRRDRTLPVQQSDMWSAKSCNFTTNASAGEHEEDNDLEREAARQRGYLEKTVDSLRRKLAKDSELHRSDNLRIMQVRSCCLCNQRCLVCMRSASWAGTLAALLRQLGKHRACGDLMRVHLIVPPRRAVGHPGQYSSELYCSGNMNAMQVWSYEVVLCAHLTVVPAKRVRAKEVHPGHPSHPGLSGQRVDFGHPGQDLG
eukprot:1140244-Pelagomonas_calceolata.AAC.10